MAISKRLLTVALFAALCFGSRAASAAVVCDENGQLATASQVPVYEWRQETAQPKAMVVLVHGFTQEALSLRVLATELASENYLVFSMDLRGHGRWRHTPDGKGKLCDYEASRKDLIQFCRTAKAAHPDLDLFCLGESAGSALVAQAANEDSRIMDGMILSSPGTRPRVYNLGWLLTDIVSNIYRLNHPVSLRKYISKYASNDPRVTEEMIADPLDRTDMSAREIIRTAWHMYRTGTNLKHISDSMPLLVVQGTADHILQTKTIPLFMNTIRSPRKQCVLFPQYGHILVGTSYIQPDVMHTIKEWLDSHIWTDELTVTGEIKPRGS